jgi:membrane protein implicated in regulation of membrane protease activity
MAAIVTGFMFAILAYLATGIFLHMSFIRYFWLMLGLAAASAVVAMAIAKAHEAKAEPDETADDAPAAPRPDLWGRDPRQDPFAT